MTDKKLALSGRATTAILVLFLGLSHLLFNEDFLHTQAQVRSALFVTDAAAQVNGSYSDPSIAEMKQQLDELSENVKLLLDKAPVAETNGTSLEAATAALEAATSALTSAVVPASPQSHYEPPEFPYHVLYGLDGDDPGFLGELEVSLKSVFLNAPLDDPLEIHLIASEKSYAKLDEIFDKAMLKSFRTRNQITIHAYNVEPMVPEWRGFLNSYFKTYWNSTYNVRGGTQLHTVGAFFRLFAHQVLDKSVQKMLYMDNDAILMANMRELWKEVAANNPSAAFHWGDFRCSGFMVLDNHRIQDVWNLAAKSGQLLHIRQPYDQDVLRCVNESFPEEIGMLSPAWDVSIANGIWRYKKDLLKVRPEIGMMHFNGGKDDKRNAFEAHNFLTLEKQDPPANFKHTFHLARYYAYMPWEWTRYWAKSMVTKDGSSGQEGYAVEIVHHENLKLVPMHVP